MNYLKAYGMEIELLDKFLGKESGIQENA